MVIGRRVSKRKGSQLVALAPEVRARLGVIPGQWLYFHLGRKDEVVISTSPARAGGKPPTADLEARLALALAQVEELTRRAEGRDRAMYAEGYSVGVMKTTERLSAPHGRSARGQRGRKAYRAAWGAGPQPGPGDTATQRALPAGRGVEVVDAPVLARAPGAPVEGDTSREQDSAEGQTDRS